MVGPNLPILAKVGEDALLTCQLLPKRTTAHMEVRWYRSDPAMPVIMYRDGAVVTGLPMEGYGGRAEWMEDSTEEGSVALKIRQVQPSDDGQYWCRFQEGDYWRETSVLLQVAGEYLPRGPGAQRNRGTRGTGAQGNRDTGAQGHRGTRGDGSTYLWELYHLLKNPFSTTEGGHFFFFSYSFFK